MENEEAQKSRSIAYLQIQAYLTLPCCIILAIGWHSQNYLAAQIYPLCVFQGLHFAWVLWSWRRITGDYFSPYTLFFIAVQFFNGGDCLLEIFGLNIGGVLNRFVDIVPRVLINKGVALTTAGMACIHLGALLGTYLRISRNNGKMPRRAISVEAETSFVKKFGWLFFAIGAAPAVYLAISSVETSLREGYMALYRGKSSFGFDNLIPVASMFCIPGLLMLLTAYARNKYMVAFFICFSAILCFLLLITGDRGTMVMLFLATLWLFHFRIKKIPVQAFAACIAAAFIVCPAVEHMRQESGMNRFSLNRLIERMSSEPNPLVASLNTMGGSMRTVPYTMMVVPEKRDFVCGTGYLWATTTVCPNIFWAEHPALKHINYGAWLTKTIRPEAAAKGVGVGFSLFAEMYLNFSWFGTLFACVLLGYAVGGFSAIAICRPGPLFYASAAILISILPYFARGSSQHVIRPLFWFCILPYMFFYIWTFFNKAVTVDPACKLKTSEYS